MSKKPETNNCFKIDKFTGKQSCVFCLRKEENELDLGPIYKLGNLITHYYCTLFSSSLLQNGSDQEGILGFLGNDITENVKRASSVDCTFCKERGANLCCGKPKCKVKFHLPCGLKNGSLSVFTGKYRSFCAKHKPVQKLSDEVLENARHSTCVICFDNLVECPETTFLWGTCCPSSFYHRKCIQRLALSAGYFFKCSICNNGKEFKKTMKRFGIYIPQQDASWECEPNAFADLLMRHSTCDIVKCLCPSGKEKNVTGTMWELRICYLCGSHGAHVRCGNLPQKNTPYECDICTPELCPSNEAVTSNICEPQPPEADLSSMINNTEDVRPPIMTAILGRARSSSVARPVGRPKKKKRGAPKRKAAAPLSSLEENLKKMISCSVVLSRL